MRTLKLTVEYDGTDFEGWQVQRHQGAEHRTVQAVLERAFQQILQERVRIVGSGRTDSGVHALGQVAHLRTRSRVPLHRLLRSANSLLPNDVFIRSAVEAPPSFHAQRKARRKRYRYTISLFRSPLTARYAWHVPARLNMALMRREARRLVGRHDFRAFHATGSVATHARRTISALTLRQHRDSITLDIVADGFVYRMVRRIVGTLVAVGRGLYPSVTIQRMARGEPSAPVAPTAPPHGLCLMEVMY
ncbi:MAG: tRNA pseudouridine(38-40) synthase TruA [Candidatus Omnitrophica bacterium]|nr:tRNA pseudouridine(38-40) synthase TruA [Candidatus Omnitrophota bacterium]